MKRLPRTLDETEIRVLGALLEKEQATPDYYPMTVNGLTAACNQKTNRDPVMQLSEATVQETLDHLFNEDVFAWRSRAGRTTKWKQNVDRRWQLGPAGKAVLTLLMLRGPQTVGELRARGDRLHEFENLDAVEQALQALSLGEEPLVEELPRRPGQKESRWIHRIGGAPAREELALAAPPDPGPGAPSRLDRLEARVEELERLVSQWSDSSTGGTA